MFPKVTIPARKPAKPATLPEVMSSRRNVKPTTLKSQNPSPSSSSLRPVLVAAQEDAAEEPPKKRWWSREEKAKDDKAPRAGMWPRFIVASFVIVLSMATATSASLLLYLNDIAEAIGAKLPGVEDVLTRVDGGEPQTVLILGSDIRPEIEKKGRSDTTMLLRLDADKNVLSLLSLPRDLKVSIPGYGIGKLNEAYTVGGPKKTLETVNNLTGLDINHVVNINFSGFAKAVDAIECVFVDVDRDYFISNEGVFDESQKISEIDIDAGYQQLCGFKALQYVRFRHDDNDLVRAARQQSFLREARQKVPPERLFEKRNEFIDIFTKYTTSDIDDPIAMLDTLKLFIELRDAPVRRIEFQGDIGDATSTYVTASDEQIKTAVKQFLGEKPAPVDQLDDEVDTGGGGGGGGGGSGGGGGPAAAVRRWRRLRWWRRRWRTTARRRRADRRVRRGVALRARVRRPPALPGLRAGSAGAGLGVLRGLPRLLDRHLRRRALPARTSSSSRCSRASASPSTTA